MPYKSKRQQRKFHAMLAKGEIDSATVREFDKATEGHYQELPEKVPARGRKPTRKGRKP